MSLIELVDSARTDKNTVHSYLPLYQNLLACKKTTAKNVLEVGICQGGSIKLWHDFYTNANVHALDIIEFNSVFDEIKNKERIYLYTSTDAYNPDFVNTAFVSKNIKFDVMLDDGPHSLESMQAFINSIRPSWPTMES